MEPSLLNEKMKNYLSEKRGLIVKSINDVYASDATAALAADAATATTADVAGFHAKPDERN